MSRVISRYRDTQRPANGLSMTLWLGTGIDCSIQKEMKPHWKIMFIYSESMILMSRVTVQWKVVSVLLHFRFSITEWQSERLMTMISLMRLRGRWLQYGPKYYTGRTTWQRPRECWGECLGKQAGSSKGNEKGWKGPSTQPSVKIIQMLIQIAKDFGLNIVHI